MSMNLRIYVGPFVKCWPKGGDVYELTGGRLTDLQGESGFDAGCDIAGPNVAMESITRPLVFERTGESSQVVDGLLLSNEVVQFTGEFMDEIDALREHYGRVVVEWGIVPGWL